MAAVPVSLRWRAPQRGAQRRRPDRDYYLRQAVLHRNNLDQRIPPNPTEIRFRPLELMPARPCLPPTLALSPLLLKPTRSGPIFFDFLYENPTGSSPVAT